MVIQQIVDIPANRRIALEVPQAVPVGKNILSFTPVTGGKLRSSTSAVGSVSQPAETLQIDEIRRLLQNEMAEKGTSAVTAVNGDGWGAHVMEHYAEP